MPEWLYLFGDEMGKESLFCACLRGHIFNLLPSLSCKQSAELTLQFVFLLVESKPGILHI